MRTLIILLSFSTQLIEEVKAVFYWVEPQLLLQLGQDFLPLKKDRKSNVDLTASLVVKLSGFFRIPAPGFDLKSLLLRTNSH